MKSSKIRKTLLWVGVGGLLVIAIAALIGLHIFHKYVSAAMLQDIREGISVGAVRDPAERFEKYLEKRYGPMNDPAHQRAAFLDFFNTDHIRALQWLVKSSGKDGQAEIDATADWVANYRTNMSQQDRDFLRDKFKTDEGKSMLRNANAQYNTQDVYYRGATSEVISELLTTIRQVQQ